MDSGENNEDELDELEVLERLYAVIHHADDTQQNVEQHNQNNSYTSNSNALKSTVRRYWHTADDQAPVNTQYQKVNPLRAPGTPKQAPPANVNMQYQKVNPLRAPSTPKQAPAANVNMQYQKVNPLRAPGTPKHAPQANNSVTPTRSNIINNISTITEPKEETSASPKCNVTSESDLASFGCPLAKDTKITISIDNNVELLCLDVETSDEDEVIEVALPPKPTITIESSDEDEMSVVVPQQVEKPHEQASKEHQGTKRPVTRNGREHSTSPVLSVVSSVSDDFIRGDCIALNISSRCPDNPSFDFSLHGSDLLGTPSKKKKKKKKKLDNDSPPIELTRNIVQQVTKEFFATPKNKAKNKKQKTKTYAVTQKSLPNPDIYDSDSNQSFNSNNKPNYVVTDKSLPCADVYESDSGHSDITKIPNKPNAQQPKRMSAIDNSESLVSVVKEKIPLKPSSPTNLTADTQVQKDQRNTIINTSVVDLTDDLDDTDLQEHGIEENIFMANVTGFEEPDDYSDREEIPKEPSKLGSINVPAILHSNLDFNNLRRNEKGSQQYSSTKLRDEMETFYNESWGGENFNHREIQKTMSRDRSLWQIDPKDRMPSPYRRKTTCNYCGRAGHRDDTCRMKPPICHMCGNTGHREPRCPQKICVNCGSPNIMYSTICRNCSEWGRVTCNECQQVGHPASHCPDLWRRYHNTIDNNGLLEKCLGQRKNWQLKCSGCTRRGHLVHGCRLSLPFSGLPINSPYVFRYQPIYPPSPQHFTDENDKALQNNSTPRVNKRQSKSPAAHETHASKKRRQSAGEGVENRGAKEIYKQANPQPLRASTPHRMRTQSENTLQKYAVSSHGDLQSAPKPIPSLLDNTFEKAPDYIAITSANHDKMGQMIQDNEVSDTSDFDTSARIYITNEVLSNLRTKEGQDWLKVTTTKHSVRVEDSDTFFLNAKGKQVDLEAFQSELRDWSSPKTHQPETEPEDPTHLSDNIPKNRNSVIRKLARAFQSLQGNLGDPKALLKELNYHQHNHYILQKQKIVSPEKLGNSTDHIKDMVTKLNMLFLGQAGLGGGASHMLELRSLAEQLTNIRAKKITLSLRKKIGEHYQAIFTAVTRTDYPQLLAEYLNSNRSMIRQTPMDTKKKKKKKPKRPAPDAAPTIHPFPTVNVASRDMMMNIRASNNTLHRLVYYHRRLTNDGSKQCLELARRFHGIIASFKKTQVLSSKSMKKCMKLQEQADLFIK